MRWRARHRAVAGLRRRRVLAVAGRRRKRRGGHRRLLRRPRDRRRHAEAAVVSLRRVRLHRPRSAAIAQESAPDRFTLRPKSAPLTPRWRARAGITWVSDRTGPRRRRAKERRRVGRTNINGRNSCEEFHARFAAVSHFSRFVAPEKVTLARAGGGGAAVMGEGGRSEDADGRLTRIAARARGCSLDAQIQTTFIIFE